MLGVLFDFLMIFSLKKIQDFLGCYFLKGASLFFFYHEEGIND
jgi:hypothetical protein